MKSPPSKDLCLMMSKIEHQRKRPEWSWVWLVVWGFYEMYEENWYGGKA